VTHKGKEADGIMIDCHITVCVCVCVCARVTKCPMRKTAYKSKS